MFFSRLIKLSNNSLRTLQYRNNARLISKAERSLTNDQGFFYPFLCYFDN